MARWLAAAVILELVAIGPGCGLGGQSGTEGAMDNPCVCDGVGERTPFRGRVTAHEGTLWTVRVEELLSEPVEPEVGQTPPEAGQDLTGTWDPQRGCGEGLDIRVGDTILGRWLPGHQEQPLCPEYQDCSLERCGPVPEGDPTDEDVAEWDRCDSACYEETRETCAESTPPVWHDGSLWLAARDAEGWLFGERSGEPLHVADDEPELLTDGDACYDRFAHDACEGYDGPGECM